MRGEKMKNPNNQPITNPTPKSKVNIIGAGVAGLSTGCYLQMNGYQTQIFEMHNLPGGLCTAWKRNGYTFDGCIHSISGKDPRYKLSRYWNELIDMQNIPFAYYDNLNSIRYEKGATINFYTDPDKLEKELKSIAPQDTKFIDDFIKAAKKLSQYDIQPAKPIELWNPLDYYLSQFRTRPVMGYLIKWRKSLSELTQKCQSPQLRDALNSEFFSHYPAYFLLFSLGHLHGRNAGYPIGGSLPIARMLEKKYLALGGVVRYTSKVTRVIVKNDTAIGVALDSGETFEDADIVVSAADGHATVFELLGGRYVDEKVKKLYSQHPMWPSAVIVYLGVTRSFEGEASQIDLILQKPMKVDTKTELSRIPVTIYSFDPTLAPNGKTVIRVILEPADYQYWADLKANSKEQYDREKQRVADEVIDLLEQRLGNIKANIEAIDVATPATFQRYTNNWKGSIQGWEWLPGLIPETLKKELPGLKNFYMVGQWVMPGGGLPTALQTGRDVAQIICHRDHKKFQTT